MKRRGTTRRSTSSTGLSVLLRRRTTAVFPLWHTRERRMLCGLWERRMRRNFYCRTHSPRLRHSRNRGTRPKCSSCSGSCPAGGFFACWYPATARSRREKQWPHPPLVLKPAVDEKHCRKAWAENSVVLGYDVHGRPYLWPDRIRVMQGIVLGMTGTGKTTLLKNIISQDLARVVETSDGPRHIPMVIFDGKGDMEFFYDLLPHIHHAGRLDQLRVLNPARLDISVLYNPFSLLARGQHGGGQHGVR